MHLHSSGKKYLTFCLDFNFASLPLCEDVLCHYAASLAKQSLKHQTIKTYLSALRYTQVMAGFGDPGLSSMPWLEYVLKGIKVDLAKRLVTQCTYCLPKPKVQSTCMQLP